MSYRAIILKIILLILVLCLLIYIPFFVRPNLLLGRNNDLTEFFWPIFYYIKQNILENRQIPYWNTMWFAGTPLLPDPQNPIWYIPNSIFLFIDTDLAIFVSFFAHSLFGAIGVYLVARKIFGFSGWVSIFTASIFTLSPRFFSYLEAGHFGLVIAWNWIPYLFLSIHKLIRSPKIKPALFLAISISSIYFNHIITAAILAFGGGIYYLYSVNRFSKRTILFSTVAVLLSFAVIFPALSQQLGWQPSTTRDLLLTHPEVFPVWNGKPDFIKSLFLFNPDTEKAITLGIIPSIIAIIGFFKLKTREKILFVSLLFLLTLVSLNNVSPIFQFLIDMKWYVLLRVSTRVWVLAIIPFLYLFGKGLEKFNRKLIFIIGTLAVIEITSIGYKYLLKPITPRKDIPQEIYEILIKDKDNFRVFCLTRCIPQKKAAIYGLELVEGYGTLQQKNYYLQSQQLSQAFYRNRYSLSIPPMEIYLYEKPELYSPALAEYRVKYIISEYILKDKNLKLINKYGDYLIYQNSLYKDPNYLIYTPNFIRADTSKLEGSELIIPEVYNKNWVAYLNGVEKTNVLETRDSTREVIIKKDTKFVDFKYEQWKLH